MICSGLDPLVKRAFKDMLSRVQSRSEASDTAFSFFLNADGQTATPNDISFYKRSFFSLLNQTLRLPASVIIASVAINLLALALPLAVLQVFDRILKNHSTNTLILLLSGLFFFLVIETSLRLLRDKLMYRIALREGFYLQTRLVGRILYSPHSETSKLSPQVTSDAMNAADEMTGFLGGNGRLALLDFPFILIFLGMIACIGGWIVIVPIILIAGFVTWTIRSSEAIKSVLKKQLALDYERFEFYTECLASVATVKSLAVEPQMMRRLETILRSGAVTGHELVLKTNRLNTSGQLFANLIMISIISAGGIMAIGGSLSLGALAACILIANRVVQPVMRIIGVWGQLETAKLAQDRYAFLMRLPQRSSAPKRHDPARIELVDLVLNHDIRQDIPPAPGINLTVEPAEIVGIINRDAVQRAQLVGVIRGTVSPIHGSALIDGNDPATAEEDTAQQGVVLIGNSPVIFRGSILDNLSMFRCVSYASAISTARALGLEPVIQALPQGYDTRLDDIGGSALPTDILRAICIARAVALQPRALILDVRRMPPEDVSTKACSRAIEELRGRATILIFGRYISEMKEARRVFSLQGQRLESILHDNNSNFTEQSRRLIVDTFDLNPEA
jgi:ATP-binding cassette subfamily C protein LapB